MRRAGSIGNQGAPWKGLLTQQAATRRGAWEPSVSRNVRRRQVGRLQPRLGYRMLDYQLDADTAAINAGAAVEGIWPFPKHGGGVELVHYWDRNFYHTTPALRSTSPTPLRDISPTDPSEGADSLSSYYNSAAATVDDTNLVPPSAASINNYLLVVNGRDVNQANYGDGWVRQCIQAPPDAWSYGVSSSFYRTIGIPDDYRLGVRVSGATFGGQFAGRPPKVWRIWACYYDSVRQRYSNPCNPLLMWSYGTTLVGPGSPSAFLRYEATGSSDPSVDEVHFFRSSENGTKGYLVSKVPNAAGTVTSGQDSYGDRELQARPVMEADNHVAPIARHAHHQKGHLLLGGGFDIDLTGNFAVVRNGSRTVTFFSAVLNESFVGTSWRFGSSARTYYCKRVVSDTEMELTEDYEGVDATLAPTAGGFDDVIRWNKAPWVHKWPLLNQIVIRGEASGEGAGGRVTGFGEFQGATLIFQRRAVWRLDWGGASPALEHGAHLSRIPGAAGCVSDRSFIRFGDGLCGWLSEDGWVLFDGVTTRVVTDARLQDFFAGLQKKSLARSWAVHHRAERQVLIGVRQADPASPETVAGWPDTILALDYITGEWDIHDGFPAHIGAACVIEIDGEEHVILAQSGQLPPPVSYGRGTLDGVIDGTGLALDGTVDSVTGGGLICNITGTIPALPELRGVPVYFHDGTLAGETAIITSSSSSAFTIDTAGAQAGDAYRIGGVPVQYRVPMPWEPSLEHAQIHSALKIQFERQAVVDPDQSILQLKLYRNGQEWLDSVDVDHITGAGGADVAGWRIADGVIEIDMSFVHRAGDTLTTLRLEGLSIDDYEPTDLLELEITQRRGNQTWAVIAIEVDAQPATP